MFCVKKGVLNMFKGNKLPQRKLFSFNKEQIIEDIQALKENKEQCNKLYWCLDEKPPQEHKFSRLEEFLKGTNNLEEISATLSGLVDEIDQVKKQINSSIIELTERVTSVSTKYQQNITLKDIT